MFVGRATYRLVVEQLHHLAEELWLLHGDQVEEGDGGARLERRHEDLGVEVAAEELGLRRIVVEELQKVDRESHVARRDLVLNLELDVLRLD